MKSIKAICVLMIMLFLVGCSGSTVEIVQKTQEELEEVNYNELVEAYKHCRSNPLISKNGDKICAELQRRDKLSLSNINSLNDFIKLESYSRWNSFGSYYPFGSYYNSRHASYFTLTHDRLEKTRRNWYVAHHKLSDKTKQLILDGRFATGWSTDHLLASLGKPKDINRTVSRNCVHEQWIYYSGYYIYFENAILKSWQD